MNVVITRQVFDAEHLVAQMRRESNPEPLRISKKEGLAFGNWYFHANSHGQILVTHEDDHHSRSRMLLVLVSIGFCFVDTEGNAILFDDAGTQQLSASDVKRILTT